MQDTGNCQLTEKWFWSGGTTMPSYVYVKQTPLVINLNDDNSDSKIDLNDIPDIVFVSTYPVGATIGILRAISGKDGSELFSVTNTDHYCSANATCVDRKSTRL